MALTPSRRPPPSSLAELRLRVEALAGRSLGELAMALGVPIGGSPLRTKGQAGQLLERALGADGGSAAAPDFPSLGVELKTVPIDESGAPRESTFVCTIDLATADEARWEDSLARAKLSHVLFVPIEAIDGGDPAARRIGRALFFRPTVEQESVLRSDFNDLMGTIGAGGAESVTAHQGRWLQVRPKAAHASVRTLAPGAIEDDGVMVETGPRGFYLRRKFVAALLRDAGAVPE